MEEIVFLVGLPNSGKEELYKNLSENNNLKVVKSGLPQILNVMRKSWNSAHPADSNIKHSSRTSVFENIVKSYYENSSKIVIDDNDFWLENLELFEDITKQRPKIICCVNKPIQILSLYEKRYRENPKEVFDAESMMGINSSVASRAYYYSNPNGSLGVMYQQIQDILTRGYYDCIHFVDAEIFHNQPIAVMKKVYEFLGCEYHQNSYTSKPVKINNPVEYLGLPLFEQYNTSNFWDGLIL